MGETYIVDGTTKQAIMRMTECLLAPGEIKLGWNDIRKVLGQDGMTAISFGSGTGHDRVYKACEDALASHQAFTMAKTATKVLFHLTGTESLLLKEVNAAINVIKTTWPSVEPIFGVARNSKLSDEVRIILLTT